MKGKFSTQQLVIVVVSAISVLILAAVAQDAINQTVSTAMRAAGG